MDKVSSRMFATVSAATPGTGGGYQLTQPVGFIAANQIAFAGVSTSATSRSATKTVPSPTAVCPCPPQHFAEVRLVPFPAELLSQAARAARTRTRT
jgi:hypothetical protein